MTQFPAGLPVSITEDQIVITRAGTGAGDDD